MRKEKVVDLLFWVASVVFLLFLCGAVAIGLFFAVKQIPMPIFFEKEIIESSNAFNLDPALVCSVIFCESSFRTDVESSSGAIGLMQLMPTTAEWIAQKNNFPNVDKADLLNADTNIILGCAYLQYLFSRFENEQTVLAAYNAGEGNVSAWLQNEKYSRNQSTLFSIPFAETSNYCKKVATAKKVYATHQAFKKTDLAS